MANVREEEGIPTSAKIRQYSEVEEQPTWKICTERKSIYIRDGDEVFAKEKYIFFRESVHGGNIRACA